MKKPFYIVFIALVLVICLIPSVGLVINGPSEAVSNETPHVMPTIKNFDGTWNLDYLDGLRDYVGYGFYTRLPAITAWAKISSNVFGTSANDSVIIGPDGWLFYREAADEMSRSNLMTDRQLWCCARSLYLMQEYVESQGAQFVFTVPCGKYTLYPEHAPQYVQVNEQSNREALMPLMQAQGVNYADLYEAFTAQDEELYWQWDSHWHGRGAALAADTILAAAGIQTDWFGCNFVQTETPHTGDLYAMLYPAGTDTEPDYEPAQGFSFAYTSDFRTSDDITITTECDEGEGSLLIFRDSSGRSLYPYLAQTFAQTYISRLNNYQLNLTEEQQADVVVVELAERTLNYLLQYPAVYPAPVRDSIPEGMQQVESEMTFDTSEVTMAGYMQVTGTMPETASDSSVYIAAGDTVYEAIPNDGSFTAWLPIDTDTQTLVVYAAL